MSNKVSFIIIAQDRYSKVAEKVRRSTGRMTTKLTSLKTSLTGVNSKFVSFKAQLKTAAIQANVFARRVGKMGTRVRNFGLGMVAGLTLPIGFMLRSFKNAARDAEEVESKFATIFSSLSSESEKVARDLGNNYGLAITKSKELLGDTGDLLTGFGFTQESALKLSSQVNELAVDLASFTNFSGGAEGASAALTKALLGERESVKSLGISILEADVKKKVSQLVSQGMRFETMRQAKAVATLQIAMEQSKNAIGDFARTNESLANQERITSARINDLKKSLGKLLLPVVLKINHLVQKLIEKFLQLSPTTQKIILIVLSLVAVLGPLVLIIGTIMISLPVIVAGFTALGAAVTTVILPIVAVVAVFFAAWKIGKKLAGVLEQYPSIWNAIGATVHGVLNPIETIKNLWAKIQELVSPLIDKLREMPLVWETIGAAIHLILNPIDSLKLGLETVIEFVTNLGSALKDLATGALDKVLSLFGIKSLGGEINVNEKTLSDINVNMTAPPGVVKDVNSKNRGSRRVNIGVNMREALE